MISLKQPTPRTCGHTCLSMLTGVDVEEIIASIGDTKTYPRDLKRELSRLGWNMEKRSCCKLPELPPGVALLFGQTIQENRIRGHWMLWTGEDFHDPKDGLVVKALGPEWSGGFYMVRRN